MVHELSQYIAMLPDVENWLAGDDRVLAFQVVDSNGGGVDISTATVAWDLFERPYQTDPAEAVASGTDNDVTLITDSRVDSTAGRFEVRVDGSVTADEWGRYTQRPSVEQSDGTVASWIGAVVISA